MVTVTMSVRLSILLWYVPVLLQITTIRPHHIFLRRQLATQTRSDHNGPDEEPVVKFNPSSPPRADDEI
jgi:hypothetical protein